MNIDVLAMQDCRCLWHYYLDGITCNQGRLGGCGVHTTLDHMDAGKELHSVNFLAVGDIMLGRGVKNVINRYGYEYPFNGVSRVLQGGDLVLANLECPITDRWSPIKKRFRFRGNAASLAAMRNSGINLVSLANNHTLDQGRLGLLDTLANLKKSGIRSVGAGHNQKAAYRPVIIEKNGLKIAFLAYTALACHGVVYRPNRASVSQCLSTRVVQRHIKRAKAKADLVIVSFHWGLEFLPKPNLLQRNLAHIAVDAGADLIIGHHPHVLQTRERYHGRLIIYSLGNFIFDYTQLARCRSTIFKCRLTRQGVRDVQFVPARIRGCRPEIAAKKSSLASVIGLKRRIGLAKTTSCISRPLLPRACDDELKVLGVNTDLIEFVERS